MYKVSLFGFVQAISYFSCGNARVHAKYQNSKMFFKDYFNSVAECMNFKYKGHQRKNQNPVDKGELCEIFIKEFLEDTFSDHFKIFRGGKIISSDNGESKQLDIVLCSKNSKYYGLKTHRLKAVTESHLSVG